MRNKLGHPHIFSHIKWFKSHTGAHDQVNMIRTSVPGRPNKLNPRAQRKMQKEVIKNLKMSSRDLEQALATVDVKVHDSTIRKRLHKFAFHGRWASEKLKFARENIDKDWDFWNNVSLDRMG